MSWNRRRFLAGSLLAGLHAAVGAPRLMAASERAAGAPLAWRNWSGHLLAHPARRLAPATEEELIGLLQSARRVRPVGAGHSFSPLVPTDGDLLVVDRLAGMTDHDPAALTATFGAGTRLANLGAPLAEVGQAMINLPDIDRQTLAGATATATHGTGASLSTLSAYVVGMHLVTAAGEVLELSEAEEPELLQAARVSLGTLGVVSRITLKNRERYRLKERNWVAPVEDVLAEFDQRAARHRHFEMFPLVHSDYALVLAIDETDEPVNNPPPSAEEAAAFDQAMAAWMQVAPAERRPLINGMAAAIEPTEAVDESYRILANVRNNRFNEMEYSVPVESGAECLREVLDTIARREIAVVFPLEYRYVAGDQAWLSMFHGGPRASISIHRTAFAHPRPCFDVIEPIFWKYEGRPHWGKMHSLTRERLEPLYPRYADFVALRRELDPQGKFVNAYVEALFG